MIKPSGESVEAPTGNVRGRGRNLSDDEARRLRDLLAVMLMDGAGLSRVDAARVLSLGVRHTHLQHRVARIPAGLRNRFRELWKDMARGQRAARV